MAICMTDVRRGLTAALLAVLAACDSGTPETFNPEATSADVGAMQSAFEAPVVASFGVAGVPIGIVTGSGGSAAVAQLGLIRDPNGDRSAYFATMSRLVQRTPAGGLSASSAAIPPEALGKTFEWDLEEGAYVAGTRTGAPSDGVRFVLYAVGLAPGTWADPLTEVGYVDVIVDEGTTSASVSVEVVSGNTTYLDYNVEVNATSGGGRVLVDGFVSNGTTRADFRLDNTIVVSGETLQFTLDYGIDVPSRDLSFDYDMTLAGNGTDGAITLSLTLNGPNGRVDLSGQYSTGAAGGTIDVDVNGDDFATITVTAASSTEADITITGADGGALTAAEHQALNDIFDAFEDGFDVFEELILPLGS